MTERAAGPRVYRRPISTWWWLRKRSYLIFMLRELSSVFVGWSVVFLLLMLYAVSEGDREYRDFLDWASSPWMVLVNVVSLLFLLLHTVTWFDLTPKAMVVKLGRRRLPARVIIASQYAGWAVVSAVILWLVTR